MIRTAFPRPRDDDSEDVAWALSTAHALWLKDHRADALVWLQRASTAAADAGEAFRAEELAHAARTLRIALEDGAFDSLRPASPSPPPVSQTQSSTSETPVRPPPFGDDFLDPWAEETPVRTMTPDTGVVTSALPLDELRRNSRRPKMPSEPPPPAVPPPLPKPRPVGLTSAPKPPPPPPPPPSVRHEPARIEAEPPITARPVTPPPPPVKDGFIALENVAAFADLPDDARHELAKLARVEELALEEELPVSGLLLVLEGQAHVQPTVLDTTAATLPPGEVVLGQGTLPRGLSLRLVAQSGPLKVAAWSDEVISLALSSLPWVLEELRARTDRLQAFAGAALGPLGESLDAQLREAVLERLQLLVLREGEVFLDRGLPVQGLAILGAGALTLEGATGASKALPGDLLFGTEVLNGGLAPATARAGVGGAILLYGDRAVTQELLSTWPPLIEVLAGA